jgi:hypothetical protein
MKPSATSTDTVKRLYLPLKAEYFDAIKAGTKDEEYRLRNAYWGARLLGRDYDEIVLTRGYPKAGDPERTLVRPWKGCGLRTICHPHFGKRKVEVYVIPVN